MCPGLAIPQLGDLSKPLTTQPVSSPAKWLVVVPAFRGCSTWEGDGAQNSQDRPGAERQWSQ